MGRRAMFLGGLAAAVVATSIALASSTARADPLRPRLVHEVRSGLRLVREKFTWRGWLAAKPQGRSWAPIWQSVHVLDAATGLAKATRLPADTARLRALAHAAESYWSEARGGFSSSYRGTDRRSENWFDDNGWLGLAFLSVYDVTRDRVYLRDAERALAYMLRSGWDDRRGGIWWSTAHGFKAGESIVTAAALAAKLFGATGDRSYFRAARMLVDWANRHLFDASAGLYVNRPGGVPISYLQSPMIDAMARLCRSDGLYCVRLRPLVDATLARYAVLRHAPQYDAMYVRFLVDALAVLHDGRFVDVARRNAQRALANARDANGLYVRDWEGGRREVRPGALQTHAASLEALAWTAVALGLRFG